MVLGLAILVLLALVVVDVATAPVATSGQCLLDRRTVAGSFREDYQVAIATPTQRCYAAAGELRVSRPNPPCRIA
jgi:hypothetical protein